MDFLHGEKVILKTETTFSFISVSTNNINEVFFTRLIFVRLWTRINGVCISRASQV